MILGPFTACTVVNSVANTRRASGNSVRKECMIEAESNFALFQFLATRTFIVSTLSQRHRIDFLFYQVTTGAVIARFYNSNRDNGF